MQQGTKEAHPTAATVERAKTGAETGQATTSKNNSTTSGAPGQKVSDYLLHGKENAVPMRHLRDLLHIPSRKVRLMIRRERLEGVPILESSHPLDGGYFLPGDEAEQARCVQEMRRRAAEIIETADAIEGGDSTVE